MTLRRLTALIIVIQWVLISYLISESFKSKDLPLDGNGIDHHKNRMIEHFQNPPSSIKNDLSDKNGKQHMYEGVAVTLMINSPRWFQRRYTAMVLNIFTNIPSTWAIQIFYTPQGLSQVGIDINPGILRLVDSNDRVKLVELPPDLVKRYGMKRRKGYLTDLWLWENMSAENILLFSGNGAICSNSGLSLLDGTAMELFSKLDYIGTPWRNLRGEGGSGSISYRNRTAMINALQFKKYDDKDPEDYFFIKTLKEMNKVGGHAYRIASKDQTNVLGGIIPADFEKDQVVPMIISGTLPNLENNLRHMVLETCPEIKMIFPSLHNPNCFGAHPNATGCAESICALQDPATHTSGC